MKEIVIVGGGASGLMCAIAVKEAVKDAANVTIVERLEKVGKKILATGNGRCNYTNELMDSNKYNNAAFVSYFLKMVDAKRIKELFFEMGMISRTGGEGRVYPFSDMASSVLDILRLRSKNLGVIEKCNFEVRKLTKPDDKFLIENTRGVKMEADYVVLATGGKAMPVLGSNGSGYTLLKPWKIKITELLPGLVGVKSDVNAIKGLSGIRNRCRVKLLDKKTKEKLWEEVGEVQFKEDGLSGIVIMQMSSRMARGKGNYLCELDLLPDIPEDSLLAMLMKRKDSFGNLENSEYLTGIFQKMLSFSLIKRCRIDLAGYVKDLTMRDLVRLTSLIKEYPIELKDFYGFDKAQVTVGGIDLSEVDKRTLQLTKVEHLYTCGEILDIDGECGGYNLQWAFSSGYVVGKVVAEKVLTQESPISDAVVEESVDE